MTVQWLKGSIIYHILVDRFSTGDRKRDLALSSMTSTTWMGGSLKGVLRRIDYLKNLGVNVIWLSPLYTSLEYHGYSVIDLFNIDEHFGDKDDLKKLVDRLHENGMKLVLDFVANHCSNEHPFFKQAQTNKNSSYYDWFIFNKWPNEYLCFLHFKNLPKWNVHNEETKEYIISAAEYWIKEFDIDGYRLDHAIGLPISFWKEFKKRVKKIKPNFALIGEVWFEGVRKEHLETLWFLEDSKLDVQTVKQLMNQKKVLELNDLAMKNFVSVFDGCLDFTFNGLMRKLLERRIDWEMFHNNLLKHYKKFPKDFYLFTFLDNHDMDRFFFLCNNDENVMKIFSSFQFFIPQPPIIYYGNEVGLSQSSLINFHKPFGDIEARRFMLWTNQNSKLLEHYKTLCSIRKAFYSPMKNYK